MPLTGARLLGKIRGFEYNTSLVFERGHLAKDHVDAWSGAWLLGYTCTSLAGTPRIAVEYNYATGDGNPHDGNRNAFEAHDGLYNPSGTLIVPCVANGSGGRRVGQKSGSGRAAFVATADRYEVLVWPLPVGGGPSQTADTEP